MRFDPATGHPAIDPETGATEPVPEEEGRYGAIWTKGAGTTPFRPDKGGSITRAYDPPKFPGAAISADGTAVAWYGGQISEQARTLSGESLNKLYGEPLWRRIANGPSEPTRRVTGGSEPESPGCLASPEAQLPPTPEPGDPCQGPFAAQRSGGIWNGGENSDYVPRLSANGDDVAFLASAPLTGEGAAFGIPGSAFNSDVYREDMTAPTRTSGLRGSPSSQAAKRVGTPPTPTSGTSRSPPTGSRSRSRRGGPSSRSVRRPSSARRRPCRAWSNSTRPTSPTRR